MVAGDWHDNANWGRSIIRHAILQGVDAIVHCGDFGWWREGLPTHHYLSTISAELVEAGVQLYWVDGNHEDHDRINEWLDATGGQPWSDKRYPNITHLPRGFRWVWWGQTWLALGGAHSVDRLGRKPGIDWWDAEHITDEQMARAMDGGHADVMITHDCPAGVSIPGIPDDPADDHRGYWPMSELIASRDHRERLAVVVDYVKPHLLIGGHYHLRHAGLRRSPDGWVTQVHILDCDATSLADNTLIMTRNEADEH
nr:metallophosphoesterase [Mycolicibacterium sp. BK634]